YWTLRPVNTNAKPFTPFVNRNDLAGWLVMALPLACGYALARLDSRRRNGRWNLEATLDDTGMWLLVALGGMAAGLAGSLSRSGLTATAAAGAALVWLSRGRLERRGRGWLIAGLTTVALVGLAYVNFGALVQ